jgi:hypothetical protein
MASAISCLFCLCLYLRLRLTGFHPHRHHAVGRHNDNITIREGSEYRFRKREERWNPLSRNNNLLRSFVSGIAGDRIVNGETHDPETSISPIGRRWEESLLGGDRFFGRMVEQVLNGMHQ